MRSNATVAAPLQADGEYALVGHKWFFSAPMSDGWLVLAQAPGGLSCFLMPRRLPDGGQTTLKIRVSDLLGGKGKQPDVPLEPNDVIMVPQVFF